MTPVLGMGIDVELVEGVGPVVERPVRSAADVERLRVPDAEEAFAPVLEAVRLVRSELPAEKAVIGFCGGPFTVAGYLVEGRPSRELPRTKALMLSEPRDLGRADGAAVGGLRRVRRREGRRAGADVVQLFDSWVGTLSPAQYRGARRAVEQRGSSPPSTSRRSTSEPARRTSSATSPRRAAT